MVKDLKNMMGFRKKNKLKIFRMGYAGIEEEADVRIFVCFEFI